MERKLVSEKELLTFLNMELRKTGQHDDCHFESLVRLRVDDRGGCNWAYASLKDNGATGRPCPPDAEKIVTRARAEYNLR
jgi:hypothetical protein